MWPYPKIEMNKETIRKSKNDNNLNMSNIQAESKVRSKCENLTRLDILETSNQINGSRSSLHPESIRSNFIVSSWTASYE